MVEQNNDLISIKTLTDNQEVQADQKLLKLSTVLKHFEDENDFSDIQMECDLDTLNLIIEFYEQHGYDDNNIKLQKPLISKNLNENVDDITYKLLSFYQGLDNMEKIKQLLNTASFYGFTSLYQSCLAVIAVQFYIKDISDEEEVDQYKKKFDLKELDSEQKQKIIDENKEFFNRITSEYDERIQQIKNKYNYQ